MSNDVINQEQLQLFEDQPIRTAWDEAGEEWYFAIVDVIGVLTESPNPQTYWRVVKKRLKGEGNETVTNCNALKMETSRYERIIHCEIRITLIREFAFALSPHLYGQIGQHVNSCEYCA